MAPLKQTEIFPPEMLSDLGIAFPIISSSSHTSNERRKAPFGAESLMSMRLAELHRLMVGQLIDKIRNQRELPDCGL